MLAFDLGGTRLKAGIVDPDAGLVRERRVVPTPARAEDALACLSRVGAELLGTTRAAAVGLCVPGLVEAGRIFALPGKLDGIIGVDLGTRLRREFGCPAAIVNDAIAFGLGEVAFGAARKHDRAVVVTIGTGIGVGVYERQRPLGRGPLGGGLLGGQIPAFDDSAGPTDTNGKRGTIEARCAAQRIVDAAVRHGCPAADVADVFAREAAGDAAARAAIAEYRRDLARALVVLAHAHAPEVIVLGGGPMQPNNPVFEGLGTMVQEALWPGYRVGIVTAACGDDAALLGIASLLGTDGSR